MGGNSSPPFFRVADVSLIIRKTNQFVGGFAADVSRICAIWVSVFLADEMLENLSIDIYHKILISISLYLQGVTKLKP